MQLQVYVDTNVYLELLASRPSVTAEMSKFLALCQNASLQLLLPQQTEEEYLSNREDVVARTLKTIKESSAVGGFPPIIQNHELSDEISDLRRDLSSKIKIVERWYCDAARKRELPFDGWFDQLKATGTILKSEADVVTRATHRAAMHMPPGKDQTLGDRLIWECLLKGGEFCEDLYLITTDNEGYRCPLNASGIRRKLKEEWADENWGNVFLYSSIEEFLQEAGKTERFHRCAEIGRAIWTLSHQSDDDSVANACESLAANMRVFDIRQARLIALAARSYHDRVFITVDAFDQMIAEFYRYYAKHLDKEEEAAIRPVAVATEALAPSIAANAN